MAFNSQKFMATAFEPRTESVPVPGLAHWFEDGEPAVWRVRGQTANEMAASIDAGSKHKNIDTIIKAIAADADQVAELQKAIGISKETHSDIIKRLEMLVQCSVDPVITLDVAVKLAETRPIDFYTLTNKILYLTGQGMDIKKSKPSGKMKVSGG